MPPKSMFIGQKINGFIDFFGLLEDIGSSQNHFYRIDFNFERRKPHLLFERCRCSAYNTAFFQLEKDKKRQTGRAFWEISGSGGLNDLPIYEYNRFRTSWGRREDPIYEYNRSGTSCIICNLVVKSIKNNT